MPLKMDHNEFSLETDLVDPIKIFFRKIYRKSVLEKNPKMMKAF